MPFLHALPEGVPTADQNLLSLLLARLGLEVVFVVGQGLQKEGGIKHVLTSLHGFQPLEATGKSRTKLVEGPPGGAEAKTPGCRCRGPRFYPWPGNQMSHEATKSPLAATKYLARWK